MIILEILWMIFKKIMKPIGILCILCALLLTYLYFESLQKLCIIPIMAACLYLIDKHNNGSLSLFTKIVCILMLIFYFGLAYFAEIGMIDLNYASS